MHIHTDTLHKNEYRRHIVRSLAPPSPLAEKSHVSDHTVLFLLTSFIWQSPPTNPNPGICLNIIKRTTRIQLQSLEKSTNSSATTHSPNKIPQYGPKSMTTHPDRTEDSRQTSLPQSRGRTYCLKLRAALQRPSTLSRSPGLRLFLLLRALFSPWCV